MKINEKVEKAINNQINNELYSEYLYLSMSAYFESINLDGFAHWMREQVKEESSHAMKLYKYLIERGGKVDLTEIKAPPKEWTSPLNAMEAAYEHETQITEMINKLVDIAVEEKDKATEVFLDWFVDEQVEEEASADKIVQQLKIIKGAPGPLFMLNSVLNRRGRK
ncbi:MAG: ferritin [Candidatus Woesearchaeota archaeon]|jgi:ferritin|nr:ferritin [Candidatus Woesearchaeota archaeon]